MKLESTSIKFFKVDSNFANDTYVFPRTNAMNKIFFVSILLIIFISGCATMSGGLKELPEPEPGNVMIVGTILLENIDQPFVFTYFDLPMKVVLLGKSEKGDVTHYIVTTDKDGYFCLPNVPQASYLLKAVIFQEPGKIPNIIANDWEYMDSKYYLMRHPERGVEYKADWFSPAQKSRIINMNIKWFGLKTALMQDKSIAAIGEVLVNEFDKNLKNERLRTNGHPYTREEPLTYFKNKFPGSGWWK